MHMSNSFQYLMTHSGVFHADDVFAAATLKILVPGAPVTRTREQDQLTYAVGSDDWVCFDVGDHHEPHKLNFDHHQRSFSLTRENGVPYAAFGLVWKHFGEQVVTQELSAVLEEDSAAFVQEVVEQVDKRLVWAIDAADCGMLSTTSLLREQPELELDVCSLSRVVAMYNPPRTEHQPHVYDDAFLSAVEFAKVLVRAQIQRSYEYLQARHVVDDADDGSPVLVLYNYVPWQAHIKDHHLFVLSPAMSGAGWMVETVQDDYVPRCPLPADWGGLRDAQLAEVSGVEDAIFCHRALFIASAQSKEGAEEMVSKALSLLKI